MQTPREPGVEHLQERLMHWHFANLEFSNAAKVHALSLRSWDQDDPYEMLGAHVFLAGKIKLAWHTPTWFSYAKIMQRPNM